MVFDTTISLKVAILLPILFVSCAATSHVPESYQACDSCGKCSDLVSDGARIRMVPGNYVSGYDFNCITVENKKDIIFDCAGSEISASAKMLFNISRSENIEIRDCKFPVGDLRESVAQVSGRKLKITANTFFGENLNELFTPLSVARAENSIISQNFFSGLKLREFGSCALEIEDSSFITLELNEFRDNSVWRDLDIDGMLDFLITQNTFRKSSGTAISIYDMDRKSRSISITENIIEDNAKEGISILDAESVEIVKNKISGNDIGIYLGDRFEGIVTNNEISNNRLNLYSSIGTYHDCDFSGNFWGTNDCSLVRKKISSSAAPEPPYSPIIDSFPVTDSTKTIDCQKEDTETIAEYYSDRGLIFAAVRVQKTHALIPKATIKFFFGDKSLGRKTNDEGIVVFDVSSEPELLKNIGSAKAVFEGNDPYNPSESQVSTTPAYTSSPDCSMIVEGDSPGKKINVVYVVPKTKEISGFFESSNEYMKIRFLWKTIRDIREYLIDESGAHKGFGSIEPFRSNIDSFNFYLFVDWQGAQKWNKAFLQYTNSLPGCKADRIIVLEPSRFRSYAHGMDFDYSAGYIRGEEDAKLRMRYYTAISVEFRNENLAIDDSVARVQMHEAGHLFGLADEYVEPSKGSRPRYPNCASTRDEAIIWASKMPPAVKTAQGFTWPYALDLQKEPRSGCSYVLSNYRLTHNGLMRDHTSLSDKYWPHGYGKYNEWFLGQVIGAFGS